MSLQLINVRKPNPGDKVLITRGGSTSPVDAQDPDSVNEFDLVETQGATSSVQVNDATTPAARVYGTNSYISVYYPPATLDRIYYNNSYRYKLRCPGGYVGIRG